MNILVVTADYPDSNNLYQGIFVKEQAYALAEEHSVTVFIFKNNTNVFNIFPKATIICNKTLICEEHLLSITKGLPIINQFIYLFLSYKQVVKLVKTKKIELLHCHFTYPSAVIAYFIKLFYNIPYIITEHSSKFENQFRSKIHKFLTLLSFTNANRIICVSDPSREKLIKYQNSTLMKPTLVTISNFIDESKFSLKSELVNKDIVNIGFLGDLNTNKKGLDILLKALSKADYDFILHIGGAGIFLEKNQELARTLGISNKCIFYQGISPETSNSFFNKLDFFVLSSRIESFGIVVIEALACGLPVIATICGGPEYILNEELGILIEKNNVDELVVALHTMRNSYYNYDPNKIREFCLSNYSKAVYIRRMDQLINNLIINHDT